MALYVCRWCAHIYILSNVNNSRANGTARRLLSIQADASTDKYELFFDTDLAL